VFVSDRSWQFSLVQKGRKERVSDYQSSKGGYHLLVLVRRMNWFKEWIYLLSVIEERKERRERVRLRRMKGKEGVWCASPSWFSGSGHCSLV
jgi:hypothetical protein